MDSPEANVAAILERAEPYLSGTAWPETAEELMRTRYAAFASGKIEFIRDSHHPDSREEVDLEQSRQWSKQAEWLGFEVLNTEGGGPDDDEGTVEFIARYSIKDVEQAHHEQATFQKVDGKWYFVDGVVAGPGTYRREEPKVGRNDPCPCGSGKKYKKCHGKPGAAQS